MDVITVLLGENGFSWHFKVREPRMYNNLKALAGQYVAEVGGEQYCPGLYIKSKTALSFAFGCFRAKA
jgi:hypothetical protein